MLFEKDIEKYVFLLVRILILISRENNGEEERQTKEHGEGGTEVFCTLTSVCMCDWSHRSSCDG